MQATSRSFLREKSRDPVKNPNLPNFLLMTLKNADVSKNLVTSYGFSGWHFFQEVWAHTHAKYLGKWPSGTVIFRGG